MSPPQQQQPSSIPNCFHKKPASVPDFILTAFSLFVLFSSPKPNTLIHKFSPPISIPRNSRRFVRIPSMSSYNRRFQGRQFATPQSLSDWLNPRLPSDSFASWGVKPGTKNVHNLWLELSEGETSLADSTPPVRTVEVVIVRVIGKHNRILVESHQELSDGSIRNRCRPLSEKMKPGESFEFAAVRAVKEELGSAIPIFEDGVTVRIVPDSYLQKVEERLSLSYPGLPAHYILHSVDAWVDGLPEEEFSTEEEAEYEQNRVADEAIFCKKHHWKWIEIDSV
ncbi:uncharacterized protein LOC124931699 [Impatiens glandulifera]|uniref:uncharacterized protein LOC124931699 n=1 Tax=Impatiens glandulifera TaxID=253017 RepID=UPI001FB0F10D|nr:uncharacterized protein LOC124931699 [Impatiens glandulifera]